MDALLVIFVGGFALGGLRSGFVRSLLGLAFLALAFVAGAYLRHPVGALAGRFVKGVPVTYTDMLGYAVVFPVTLIAAHLVARPFLSRVAAGDLSRAADQVLGAVFGALEATLIISAVIVILDTYFGTKSALHQVSGLQVLDHLTASLDASATARLLRTTTIPFVLAVLGPLLPRDIAPLLPGNLPVGLPRGLPGGLPGGTPVPSI